MSTIVKDGAAIVNYGAAHTDHTGELDCHMRFREFRAWQGATRRARTVHQLLAQLDKLGSAAAIADFFLAQGVRGTSISSNCPVQKWLRIETGARYCVGHYSVIVHSGERAEVVAPLPQAVRDFICRFDSGNYADLHLPVDLASGVTAAA